jgi:uncharacterized membrane protein
MSFKIASSGELYVQKDISITSMEEKIENQAAQRSESDKLVTQDEVKVSISDEGRKLFDENGRSGTWLSDEDLIEMFGALPAEDTTVKFQYGYDTEFDDISSSFREPFKTFVIGKYAGTGIDYKNIDYDILNEMSDKYTELKQHIETNYTDDEKEQRLAELDLAYKTIYEKNIFDPIYKQLDSSMSFYRRGTLTSISGSKSFINSYYSNSTEMSGTYKKLNSINDSLKELVNFSSIQLADNVLNVKNSLVNIISSMIDITGTETQKEEYALINF